MEQFLDFQYLDGHGKTYLSSTDLRLFYYDICFDRETAYHSFYEWNEEIENYLKKNGTTVGIVEKGQMLSTIENDRVLLTLSEEDKGNKAACFFRHLRNSFFHYNIEKNNDYYCIKDYYPNSENLSMIGIIKTCVFTGLISLFFDQKTKIEGVIFENQRGESYE